MFTLLHKLSSQKNSITLKIPIKNYTLCHLQIQKSLKFSSVSQDQLSPTISYLINKCGLPLNSAISLSRKININSTKNPDSVLQLLKKYDFTQAQIQNLIVKFPNVLLADPDKSLQPKFEFFESVGVPRGEIGKKLAYKNILSRSMTQQILPTYTLLKRFLETDKDIVAALIQIYCGYLVSKDFHLRAESNIEALKNHGVPDFSIRKLIITIPKVISLPHDQFMETVGLVEGMRLDPHSLTFSRAVGIMGLIGKAVWENKIETYKRFGWSEEDVISAFKVQPRCVATSERKIATMLEFYLNELGLSKYDVIKYPNLVMASLEKRIIPRCSVLQVLVSNGLIEKGLKLPVQLNSSKKDFEKKFMETYKEAIPEVLKAYKGELGYPRLEVLRGI